MKSDLHQIPQRQVLLDQVLQKLDRLLPQLRLWRRASAWGSCCTSTATTSNLSRLSHCEANSLRELAETRVLDHPLDFGIERLAQAYSWRPGPAAARRGPCSRESTTASRPARRNRDPPAPADGCSRSETGTAAKSARRSSASLMLCRKSLRFRKRLLPDGQDRPSVRRQ